MKKIFAFLILVVIGGLLLLVVQEMPSFGDPNNPARNQVYERYIEDSPQETGIQNSVSAIIADYRAFDTLGELTVLLTAIAGLLLILKS